MPIQSFENPYRPGAGHMPPYLAGREGEYSEFERLLGQTTIFENLVLTGLRGVGKTVLLETFKPRALAARWLWAGTDLSESASVSEMSLALRLMADLSLITSSLRVPASPAAQVGFAPEASATQVPLSYDILVSVFQTTPGLVADKLKAVLEFAWQHLRQQEVNRVIFAYDEAQNLSDKAERNEYPLSTLLDVFQSIQRKGIPFMLVLTGLPTLFPKLVDARTYAERMFRVVTLGRLTEDESQDAIIKPLEKDNCPLRFNEHSVETVIRESGGYPYFIQFMCREVYDVFIQQAANNEEPGVPVEAILRKLDSDFFAGRWSRVTDRQRQLLWVVARLGHGDDEFTIQELVTESKLLLPKSFSSSHASQMLVNLGEQGLIYKNRFGKYSFAVPLLGNFILRTYEPPTELRLQL
jgi:hypothetical protein